MVESYLSKARSRYFQNWESGQYCMGKKSECSAFGDNTIHLPWDKSPGQDRFKDVLRLRLVPTISQLKKMKLPECISDFSELEFLHIPFPFVQLLSSNSFPKNIKVLMVENKTEFMESLHFEKIKWPSDVELNLLDGLIFTGDYDAGTVWHKLNINGEDLSKVKYLNTSVDKKGAIIDELVKFSSLEHLEIGSIKSYDFSRVINEYLKVLHINSAAKNFPIESLVKYRNLEMLNLMHVGAEIDCEIFLNLPELIEINFIGCKKIKNISAVLKCPAIRSMEVTDCNNPFKRDDKKAFESLALDRLDIDYA